MTPSQSPRTDCFESVSAAAERAFESARAALNSVGGEEITLYALPRREASPLFIYD